MKESEDKFTTHLASFRDYIYTDLLGGPKLLPLRYVINFFKCLTFVWVIGLMIYFQNTSKGMYLYLFLHGSYGLCWCVKDLFWPDQNFKQKGTLGSLIALALFLLCYWSMPVTIAMGYGVQEPSLLRTGLCICLYILGVIFMMGSDIYKSIVIERRKNTPGKVLISDGFFSRTRNPNYLGQVMIYASFAVCSGFWTSYAVVFFSWFTLFATNMYLKDELSYKKKQGWDKYKKDTYLFFPKIFPSDLINYVFYMGLAVIALYQTRGTPEALQLQSMIF